MTITRFENATKYAKMGLTLIPLPPNKTLNDNIKWKNYRPKNNKKSL